MSRRDADDQATDQYCEAMPENENEQLTRVILNAIETHIHEGGTPSYLLSAVKLSPLPRPT